MENDVLRVEERTDKRRHKVGYYIVGNSRATAPETEDPDQVTL